MTKSLIHWSILTFSMLFFVLKSEAQIVGGNGYLIGSAVEIAVHGNGGHEGTADWAGHHSRGGLAAVPYGFVANPNMDGWVNYDGDFFTAGTPENGFGLEINGTNYSNNAWNSGTSTVFLNQIPKLPGSTITHTVEDQCITVEWTGKVAGVIINIKYHLIETSLFYTTEITLTNTTGSTLNNVYYYRNVDPDNNKALTGNFATTNKIVSQPGPDCIKALVSARQSAPWPSYLGIGALGNNFRVTHGGFSNRSGSDIWNAAGGLDGTIGSEATGDNAISLAYKTNIGAGQTVNFQYAVVLNEAAVEAAFSSLYFISYETSFGEGAGSTNPCSPTTVIANSCRGDSVTLWIDGPSTDEYIWTWYPGGIVNDTIVVSPDDPQIYTVYGNPLSPCLVGTITKSVFVRFTEGPQVYYDDPGPICGEFDLTTLVYYDTDGGENTNCIFLSEEPDSANQVEPVFEGPMIGAGDDVWLMCGDSVTGCYDYVKIELNFVGDGSAGPDTTVVICAGPGTYIDLNGYLVDTANTDGYWIELTESESFDSLTGVLDASELIGIYEFWYIVEGLDSCLGDTALFTIIIKPSPTAEFEYEVLGVSSADGLNATCIINTVDFINLSTIEPPGVITAYEWSFGDGIFSALTNPSHTYLSVGYYTVTLKVTSDNGCVRYYSKPITIYNEPEIEYVMTEPTCFDYEDGSILVLMDNVEGDWDIEITDADGIVLNGGTTLASGLGAGTYYVTLTDVSGCGATEEVLMGEPEFLFIYYRVINPPCLGDSGHVVVDSVAGESLNNPIWYTWDPNPAGIEGVDADSSYWMVAGDYTLTATDSKGCFNTVAFTLVDPPLFYFTDWGSDSAYCRLFNYQSGNGFVYVAVAGGIPVYNYHWTYLVDGTTSNTTTWGGRNPGDHRVDITDAGGCVLTKIIHVDSINPEASFTIASEQLNATLQGTAPVSVEYTNTSRFFADPNDPDNDTLFLWDMDRTVIDDWLVSRDWFEKFDTTYLERGESYDIEICLIAYNKNGCSDTACKVITIFEPPLLAAPNIFSPNKSGENDFFTFEYMQKGIKDFHCIIVNRWGVQVGEINGIRDYWDGRDYDGDYCTDGVYFYTYTGTADNGETFSGQGTVTLVGSEY